MYWSDEEDYYSDHYFDDNDDGISDYDIEHNENLSSYSTSSNEENQNNYQLKEIKIDNNVYVIRIPYIEENIFITLLEVLQYSNELNGRIHWNAGNFYCSDKRDEQILKNLNIVASQYLPIDPMCSTVIFDKEDIIINY